MPHFEDRAAAVRPGEELNLKALDAYLRAHFPDERGPLDVKQFPSGHSNLTYSVHLGDRELVRAVLHDLATSPLPDPEKALLGYVDKLNLNPSQVRQDDIDARSPVVEIDYDGAETPGRLHVLALGVSQYTRNALRFADRDAVQLAEYLHPLLERKRNGSNGLPPD